MADPYKVLGVTKSASPPEIKSAFRKRAKKFHPDQNRDNPRAKERFAEVNSAYEILGDKDKKARFDRGEIDADGKERFAGFEGFQGGNPFDGFTRQTRGGGAFSAEEILAQMFGSAAGGTGGFGPQQGFGGRRRAPARGADVKVTARVALEDMASGKVEVRLGPGRTVAASIPPGATDGQVVRLKGQGQASPGGKGDALVTLSIQPHKIYRRDGDDLRMELPVPLKDAVLGAKARVATLDGAVSLTIPPWSNSGRIFRLKNKGLPKSGGKRGDLLVAVNIMLPDQIDDQLVDLMKQLQPENS